MSLTFASTPMPNSSGWYHLNNPDEVVNFVNSHTHVVDAYNLPLKEGITTTGMGDTTQAAQPSDRTVSILQNMYGDYYDFTEPTRASDIQFAIEEAGTGDAISESAVNVRPHVLKFTESGASTSTEWPIFEVEKPDGSSAFITLDTENFNNSDNGPLYKSYSSLHDIEQAGSSLFITRTSRENRPIHGILKPDPDGTIQIDDRPAVSHKKDAKMDSVEWMATGAVLGTVCVLGAPAIIGGAGIAIAGVGAYKGIKAFF